MDEQWELILWDTLTNTLDHLDHQDSMLISMIRNSLLTSAGMCGYRVFSWLLSVVRNICRADTTGISIYTAILTSNQKHTTMIQPTINNFL